MPRPSSRFNPVNSWDPLSLLIHSFSRCQRCTMSVGAPSRTVTRQEWSRCVKWTATGMSSLLLMEERWPFSRSQSTSRTDHSWRVTVLERAPTDIVKRRHLEKLWIKRLRGSQLFTVLNRDDGLGILVLWIRTSFCLFLYFLCQFLHFSFSPCAYVNPISSFLLLPLLLVLPYLAPVHWCLGTGM